jgi:zinc protease
MQKATPLILVLILAVTAVFLSLRETPPPPVAGQAEETQVQGPEPETREPVPGPKPPGRTEAVDARSWPHEMSDIPPEKEAVFGTLPNGFRYVILPNPEPPARVSLRLHIAAGSLMEEEDQRGLAHFLEHMVFNGTKSHSAAELVPRMQRLGIAFGAHANAYTSFDETVYMLDLPDLSGQTMELAFTVMRDFGDGALLEPEEIDKERGVILAEKSSRDSVGRRIMERQFAELLPDSLLTRRFPIGEEEVIRDAQRERFVDFYTRYYTPARMTFIVVGDVDPSAMKDRIETAFSSLTNPETPGDDPELGPVTQAEGLETAVFADRELGSTDVSLMLMRPHTERPDTVENRIARMPLNIAHAMLSRRFERMSKEEGSPVASGSASNNELFNYIELGSIDITAADDRWEDAVPVLEREFRRALEHGFTEAELAEVKANLLNSYQQAVLRKPTRRSDGLATVLARAVNDNTVFSSPEADLDIVTRGLERIDAAACHEALVKFWDAPGHHLILTTKEEPENAEKRLAALYEDSRGSPVEAPAARAVPVFDYEKFGKSGTVAKRTEAADLGITQLVLSNRVRVNLKPTEFEKGRIRLSARIGSGQLGQPADSPMLDAFVTAVFGGGGLGKHSNEDLRQILAGRNAGSSLSIGEDAFTLDGMTTREDFGLQVRLMCASITDPGWRNEGLWEFQRAIPMIYQQLRHTTAGPERELNAWLRGGDARYATAPMEKLAAYTIDDARKWLAPELAKGYLELSIAGDFAIDDVLPEILATFGALPVRAAGPPDLPKARKVAFPNAPADKSFTYESKIPQAVAYAIWKTPGLRDNQPVFRRLNILASIYGDRLREEIREKLGASYSPNAGADGSDALDDFGFILGQSAGKPEDLDLLLDTMRDLADSLATEGASEDELDRALQPVLGQLEKTLRDNGYWLNTVMGKSQADPKRLELARNRDADYRSITLGEINELAKKHLSAGNALLVRIQPAEND